MPREKEEVVSVPKAQWDEVLSRLEKIENNGVLDLDEPKQRFCNVKLYDGKPVSRIFDVKRNGIDPVTGDEVMACKLELAGEETPVEADYLQLIRSGESVKGEIIDVEQIDISPKTTKTVAVKTVEEYNTISTGVMVPLRVKTYQPIFKVKLPDDSIVSLKSVNL